MCAIFSAGLWLGLPACIEEFDNLIKEFFKSSFTEDREKIIAKAEKLEAGIKDEDKKSRAGIYIKTMRKCIEKGDEFITQESARVEKLSGEKISEKKKRQLQDRANILTSFSMRMKGQPLAHEKDEL